MLHTHTHIDGDSADAGMSIVATTDNDEELALRLCRELGQGATETLSFSVSRCLGVSVSW
jgi:hypothetical protein